MKTRLLLCAAILFGACFVRASLIFDVTFESPLYSNGQEITGGPEPNQPTAGNIATVSDSILGFGSQAALFTSSAQVEFRSDQGPYASGLHLVTWEMGTPVWPSFGNVTFESNLAGVLFTITFLDSNA